MGLAASQARFLAITARKANCEFQSMQIAQEKLSTTRDLQRAADEYQNALDATKLVWDIDGDTYNLSYDLMMKPSTLNDYTPYLITDTKGKVVLSNAMFRAAMEAGIIDKNGDPTFGRKYRYVDKNGVEQTRNNLKYKPFMGADDATNDSSRNAFLYQMSQINNINGSIMEKIIEKGPAGYSRSGIGGAIYDKSTANALTTQLFENYMKTAKGINEETGKEQLIYGIADALYGVFGTANEDDNVQDTNNSVGTVNSKLTEGKFTVVSNGQPIVDSELQKLTMADLLRGNYEIVYNGSDGEEKFAEVLHNFAYVFGNGDTEHIKGLNIDTESNEALSLAYDYTKRQITGKNVTEMTGDAGTLYNKVKGQTNTVNSGNLYAMSLTNLVASYLTNFARALDGLQTSYYVDDTYRKKSNFVTDDFGYYFMLKNDAAMTDEVDLNADFYNMLYNVISTNGACTDETLRNAAMEEESLQEALKNGTMFVSYLNTDGYFYQGPYTLTDKIAEVTDTDAIARAEREYEVTKSKLNTKEETLELKMKNLDMEISSLTTEFDTVKNMISKGVEKVFTMFST